MQMQRAVEIFFLFELYSVDWFFNWRIISTHRGIIIIVFVELFVKLFHFLPFERASDEFCYFWEQSILSSPSKMTSESSAQDFSYFSPSLSLSLV